VDEHAVRTEAHRELIASLWPQLPIERMEPIGRGWDSDTYAIDRTWVVQVPRTPAVAEAMRRQLDLLPELSHEVSALVPIPELVSHDPVAMAYRMLEGVPLTQVEEHGWWPERLGRFLYDLHMVPPEFVGLRGRGADDERRATEELLGRMREHAFPLLGDIETRVRTEAMAERFLADDDLWRFAPVVTHGDLGPEHVLVTPSGDLVGVIDWGDVGMGDPAADFAWMLHAAPSVGERALAAYGGPPDGLFRDRARIRFALMPWHDVLHGLEVEDRGLIDDGLAGAIERLPA
jgi:aminoglycoside 2''-phosphotransferase